MHDTGSFLILYPTSIQHNIMLTKSVTIVGLRQALNILFLK